MYRNGDTEMKPRGKERLGKERYILVVIPLRFDTISDHSSSLVLVSFHLIPVFRNGRRQLLGKQCCLY